MNATQAINMVARQVEGDNESWSLRAYFTIDNETSAKLREDARDLINEFHLLAGVRPEGLGVPGAAFAHFPSIRCVGHRVILTQSGGLDI